MANYTVMNYNELQKLYPEFKIPYEKEVEYYIQCLRVNDPTMEEKLNDFTALGFIEPDPVRYKFKKFDEIMAYFKQYNLDMNLLHKDSSLLNSGYTLKEFNNYKSDKFYFSIDLREANWQAFKHAQSLSNKDSFEEFTTKEFDLHPAIARSKSFRQFLFGNTNPKRLQKVQESMMHKIYESLGDELKSKVVGKKSDELLFESDNHHTFEDIELTLFINMSMLNFWIKTTYFTVSEHTNFNEFVRIKKEFPNGNYEISNKQKLMGVPGNRFFIHYKTLILNDYLDERDLYFVQDKNLAKWVIDSATK